jgi:hypothetical protein
MAIYHFQKDTVSKAKRSGKHSTSASKKSHYNERTGRYENHTAPNDQKAADQSHYNERKEQFSDRHEDEIVFKGHGNMPKWAKADPQKDPQHYWDACDKYERSNGRLAQTFIVAMPRELTDEQRVELAGKFSADLAKDDSGHRLPFSWAIHQDGDNHNPHLHLMISERINDGINRNASSWFKRAHPSEPKNGGARKTQDLTKKHWLYDARKKWEVWCNDALNDASSTARVDCRSLKARGIDRPAHVHHGIAKHNPAHPAAEGRLDHNAAVKEIIRKERAIAHLRPMIRLAHEPAKPFARFAVNTHRGVILDAARQAKRGKNLPITAPRHMVLPKQFTAKAIMEYMARIGEEIAASILKTAQMELDHQRQIAAMWADLRHVAADPIGNGLYTPGGRVRAFAPVIEKHDPARQAITKTRQAPTVADQLALMTQRAKAAAPPSHVIQQAPRPRW